MQLTIVFRIDCVFFFYSSSYHLVYSVRKITITISQSPICFGPNNQRYSIYNKLSEAANPHIWDAETSECLAIFLDKLMIQCVCNYRQIDQLCNCFSPLASYRQENGDLGANAYII